MSKDDSAPAFPAETASKYYTGMTLRDYFAAKAMAALMPVYWAEQDDYVTPEALVNCQVQSAYEYADAMLKERSK